MGEPSSRVTCVLVQRQVVNDPGGRRVSSHRNLEAGKQGSRGRRCFGMRETRNHTEVVVISSGDGWVEVGLG